MRKSRLVGKPLTAKQQQVADMKAEGKTNIEIGSAMGISPNVVAKYWTVINKKLGSTKTKGEKISAASSLETKDPERAAAVLDAMTEPAVLKTMKEAYEQCGLPPQVSAALLRRLRTKYFGVVTATKNLKASEIAQLFSEKIDLAARYMDDKTAGEASFRDLALASTAMAEKRQLLRGEPTQIISDHERKKLHELLPAFIEEAKRRGVLTVEGQVTEKTVEPG